MAPTILLQIASVVVTLAISLVSSQSYIFYDDKLLAWQDGNALCAFSYGTSLASIQDATEDNEADSMCPDTAQSTGCWVGLTLLDPGTWTTNDGTWKWSDGTMFSYGNDTSGGIPPWTAANPVNNQELCVAIDKDTVGWNDDECNLKKPILCNTPSNASSIVIDDNINNVRQPPVVQSTSVGTMDILDDIHVEFDFKVSSLSMFNNILHIGSDVNTRLPTIFIMAFAGKPGVKVHFSRIDNSITSTDYAPISFDTWYHVSLDITQSTTSLSIDGSTVANRTNKSSHVILYNQDIYIMSHFVWLPIDGLIRDLKITTNNAYQTPFNYLCDYENRFSVISGSWSIDTEKCWLSQTSNEGGNVVWLGDADPTSVEWIDYTIEFVVRLQSSDLESAAQAGLLFRALSVSSTNNDGQQYWVDIKKATGIRFRQADEGELKGNTNHDTIINWNEDYTVRVKVVANTFSIYLNDRHVLDDTNSDYSYGSIGFRTHQCKATFKRLRIIFPNSNTRITLKPTSSPTRHPTAPPTIQPTTEPTVQPTTEPTVQPTIDPTSDPSSNPTNGPTSNPTDNPSINPTVIPTRNPLIDITIESTLEDTTQMIPSPGRVREGNVINSDMIPWIVATVVGICVVLIMILFCRYRMKRIRPQIYTIPTKNSNSDCGSQMVPITDSKPVHVLTEDVIHVTVQPNPVTHAPDATNTTDITELKDWLTSKVKLPQYVSNFADNGYDSMEFVCDISTVDQLIEIGVTLRGHQTRIFAELKKLKEARAQKEAVVVKKEPKQHRTSLLNELEGEDETVAPFMVPMTVEGPGSPPQHDDNDALIEMQDDVTLGSPSQVYQLEDQTNPPKTQYVFDDNNDEEIETVGSSATATGATLK
eukprot:642585_1